MHRERLAAQAAALDASPGARRGRLSHAALPERGARTRHARLRALAALDRFSGARARGGVRRVPRRAPDADAAQRVRSASSDIASAAGRRTTTSCSGCSNAARRSAWSPGACSPGDTLPDACPRTDAALHAGPLHGVQGGLPRARLSRGRRALRALGLRRNRARARACAARAREAAARDRRAAPAPDRQDDPGRARDLARRARSRARRFRWSSPSPARRRGRRSGPSSRSWASARRAISSARLETISSA